MPTPIKLCAFDIETRGKVPEFISGALVSDVDQFFTENATEFVDQLRIHARKGYTLVAHNAEYDVSVLLWGQGEDVRMDYTNGSYTAAYWKYGTGPRRAAIWDSFRLAAGLPLQALGTAIGIPKFSTPRRLLDPDDVRQDWVCEAHGEIGCLTCYNTRDAEIVWGYMNMLREWLGGYGVPLKKSLPGIAMELWQLWNPNKQQTVRSRQLKALGRACYHGGRCEVFRYGSCVLPNTYDIRRYYGSLLLNARLPEISSLRYIDNHDLSILEDDNEGVIDVTVRIESQHIPPLPVVSEGRTWFPVGECRGVWPLSELRSSLVYGVEPRTIHHAAYTSRVVYPFHQTAAVLLELGETWRRQKDPREVIAKFILNAMIGRLGLRDVSERVSCRRWRKGMTQDDLNGNDIESADGAVYLARRFNLDKPAAGSNALWAGCITGMGRQRLYSHLMEAGNTALYCDTDSVHAMRQLQTGSDTPGELVSTGTYDKGLYLGPKMYRLEAYDGSTEVRAKGIPRANAAEFLRDGTTSYQTSFGVIEAIAKGLSPSTWVDVSRTGHYAPGTRTILDPSAIGQPDRSSETAPPVFTVQGANNVEIG